MSQTSSRPSSLFNMSTPSQGSVGLFGKIEIPPQVNNGLFNTSTLFSVGAKSQGTEKDMLKAVYQRMLYPDIIFVVQSQEFPAHKGILAARCKFFENMFESGMKESQDKEIKFDDITKEAFSSLIKFIYCEELNLTEDSALELLQVADKYTLPQLIKISEDFLINNLKISNYVKIVKVAEGIDNTRLKEAVLGFMGKNIHSVTQREDINEISKTVLIDLLSKAKFS